jgi:hypothetical protein
MYKGVVSPVIVVMDMCVLSFVGQVRPTVA